MGTLKFHGKVLNLVTDVVTTAKKFVVHVAPIDQEFCEKHLNKETSFVLNTGEISLAFHGRISKVLAETRDDGEPQVLIEISQ